MPVQKRAFGVIVVSLLLLSLSVSLMPSIAAGSVWTRSDSMVVTAGDTVTFSMALSSTVNASGPESFNLSASGLPSGWSCSFFYGNSEINSINVNFGETVSIMMGITTTPSMSAGNYTFTFVATSIYGTISHSLEVEIRPSIRDIQFSCSYPSVSAEEGLTFSYPITISNRESSDVLLALSCSAPEGWTGSYSAQEMSGMTLNDVYIAAGSSKTLTFKATPTSDVALGNYTLTLNAISSDGSANASLVLEASIIAPSGVVNIESRYSEMTANIGTTLNYPITIENGRSTATTLNLLVQSKPQGWSAVFLSGNVAVSNVLLASHDSISLVLQITTPSSAGVGNYTTEIGVSSSDGTVSEVIDLNTTLTGSYSLSATPDAYNVQTSTGGTATVTVTVTNTGLSPVTSVKLSVSPPSSSWSTSSSPITVQSLAAGASTSFTVEITAPSDAVAGDYLASITASSDQASSSAIAERVTLSASTTWVWIGVAIAAVAVVLMIFLFRKFGRR